jgi:Uma2 family endonuclease
MTLSPSSIHQTLALLLGAELIRTCPDDLFVSQANDVVLSPSRTYIPDLLVVNFAAAKSGTGKFAADDVVLAIEIVSPSTRGTDQLTKPTFHGRAGIPFFWLIDPRGGLTVMTYELDSETKAYEQAGVFSGDDTLRLDQPWPIEIPLSTIRPRNL